jgi:acyl carrier protein
MNVRNEIVRILAEQVSAKEISIPIGDSTPLFAGGLDLDSLALLETVIAIEQATGVFLGEDGLTEEALANVGSLVNHVSSMVDAR